MAAIQRRFYDEKVVDHFKNPRNVGSMDSKQIKVEDDGVISDACFKTFGCGSAIASSSLASEWLKGKTTKEALDIKNTEIAKELKLPPVKLHCSMLAEDAIKAAVKDHEKKISQSGSTE